jgi:hypothetical protein
MRASCCPDRTYIPSWRGALERREHTREGRAHRQRREPILVERDRLLEPRDLVLLRLDLLVTARVHHVEALLLEIHAHLELGDLVLGALELGARDQVRGSSRRAPVGLVLAPRAGKLVLERRDGALLLAAARSAGSP